MRRTATIVVVASAFALTVRDGKVISIIF